MKIQVDEELRAICKEIQDEGKSAEQWAENESTDWFQTPHYNGGFDATDMCFAFTVHMNDGNHCFVLSLVEALEIAQGELNTVEVAPSPWS